MSIRTMKMKWFQGGMGGKNPCAVCGKELTGKNIFEVHVITGTLP